VYKEIFGIYGIFIGILYLWKADRIIGVVHYIRIVSGDRLQAFTHICMRRDCYSWLISYLGVNVTLNT
jgi:hypothetical protein